MTKRARLPEVIARRVLARDFTLWVVRAAGLLPIGYNNSQTDYDVCLTTLLEATIDGTIKVIRIEISNAEVYNMSN